MDGIFTVPGDGSVDFLSLLKPLAERGYDGWLVVEAEQDPAKAHPLTYATKGYRALLAAAQEAGFAGPDAKRLSGNGLRSRARFGTALHDQGDRAIRPSSAPAPSTAR